MYWAINFGNCHLGRKPALSSDDDWWLLTKMAETVRSVQNLILSRWIFVMTNYFSNNSEFLSLKRSKWRLMVMEWSHWNICHNCKYCRLFVYLFLIQYTSVDLNGFFLLLRGLLWMVKIPKSTNRSNEIVWFSALYWCLSYNVFQNIMIQQWNVYVEPPNSGFLQITA